MKPNSSPGEGAEPAGRSLTAQSAACKAEGRTGLPCLPEGNVGLGETPTPPATGCHCCLWKRDVH